MEVPVPYVAMPQYLRVIKQANKLINKTYSIFLPHQLYLHVDLNANSRILGLLGDGGMSRAGPGLHPPAHALA